MFTFEVLESESRSIRVLKLSFDSDTTILADPSWDGKNPQDINFLETHLANVSVILLSHATPEFIGGFALLFNRFPLYMANISVYLTVPVNQLGRILTVEFYRSKGLVGPLQNAILEVSSIDEAFDTIIALKFLQTILLFDGKLVVTPYNAGHTLGGTFWVLSKKLEKIVYAPAWNHSKDSFLNSASFLTPNGNPLSQIARPTAFITNTDLGSAMSHKKRTEKFLLLVDATLAQGGTVLLPISLSGRFLELLHLIDQHLQSAPIPVLLLSYLGTKALSYASNLLEWMLSLLIKEWEEVQLHGALSKNNIPFDPLKVDLLGDATELLQLTGPKVVFCTGLDLQPGDKLIDALQYVCNDEKTTIILTEKTHQQLDELNLNAQLYREWYELAKQRLSSGEAEDGVPVPLEKLLSIPNLFVEEALVGDELTAFQEKINILRKQKLLEKVRAKKNRNLLNDDNFSDLDDEEDDDDDDDDEDEEDENDNESKETQEAPSNEAGGAKVSEGSGAEGDVDSNNKSSEANGGGFSAQDDLEAHEAFVGDYIKQKLADNEPLDLKITKKLKPRQAMFPYFPNNHKHTFDDYGEVIDIKDFQKNDEATKNRLTIDGMEDDEAEWGRGPGGRKIRRFTQNDVSNKLTPQEILNNEVLKKNLDTLFVPKKRVTHNSMPIRMRCGLSFVDLSGLVDSRSLSLIVSLLKPHNVVLLRDFTSNASEGNLNSLSKVKSMFSQQTEIKQDSEYNKSLLHSTRFMSLENIRGGILGMSGRINSSMDVLVAEGNKSLKIGYDDDGISGLGLTNFEVKLDDGLLENLKWQTIDGSYRVAQVYGELELANSEQQPAQKKIKLESNETEEVEAEEKKKLSDYINSSTQFTLKHLTAKEYAKQKMEFQHKLNQEADRTVEIKMETENGDLNESNSKVKVEEEVANLSVTGPKLAIGNIRLTELKKKLQSRNLNAEFKSEGTLVVNDQLAIRKVIYGSLDGDDTGDIVIDGLHGVLYYQVKECIREMLAYI